MFYPENSKMGKQQVASPNKEQIFQMEMGWWVFTAIVVLLILLPINIWIEGFPFYFLNTVYIVTFITLTRHLFLLKYTYLAKRESLKVIVFFLCLPLLFYVIQELNLFQTFLDENGPEAMVGSTLDISQRSAVAKYIHSEIFLFGVGSIISGVLLPLRLLLSVWRGRNGGGV